jgi:hypothetical protein
MQCVFIQDVLHLLSCSKSNEKGNGGMEEWRNGVLEGGKDGKSP